MNNSLVSICIPTYNGSEFISEAMDSAIAQSYPNLEIVVSDDVSTDETLTIIESYKIKTEIPIYIHKHEPSGIGSNWNNCVKKSNGAYIKFLFQDDTLAPTCIDKMVLQAVNTPKIGMVYSKRHFIYDANDQKNKDWIKSYSNLHESWKGLEIINHKVYNGRDLLRNEDLLKFPKNKIGEPTAVLLKREVFDNVGFFSTTLKQSLDIEFWYRAMKFYNVVFIEEELIAFRLHDNQTSNLNANSYLNEEKLFNESIYSNLFWQMHWKNKKMLFFNHSSIGIFIKRIMNLFYRSKIKIGLSF